MAIHSFSPRTLKLLIIALCAISCVLVVSTMAAINVNQNVTSSGTITTAPNIGVYSDSGCSTNLTSINWGSIVPGGTATKTVYVKNTGTSTMSLSLASSNWSPSSSSSYITISWNQQGTQLTVGQMVTATITVSVSSSITGISSFTNTIVISGSG